MNEYCHMDLYHVGESLTIYCQSPASQGFTWQPVVTWDSSSKVEAWQSCQKAVSVHLHPSWSERPPRLYFCWVCCVQQPAAGTFLMLYSRADTLLKQGNLQANYWHFNHTTPLHITFDTVHQNWEVFVFVHRQSSDVLTKLFYRSGRCIHLGLCRKRRELEKEDNIILYKIFYPIICLLKHFLNTSLWKFRAF